MKLTTIPIAMVVLLAACSDDEPSGPSEMPDTPQAATIQATPQITFDPGNITVEVNQEVDWNFESVPHNVFFADVLGRPADIPGFNSNTTVTRVFTTEGTFPYDCRIHPGMSGTVVVQGPNSGVDVGYAERAGP